MRRSTLARKFIKPFAMARASYIATGKFNLAGWLSVVIGEPICAILGHTVARKNVCLKPSHLYLIKHLKMIYYKSLYAQGQL